MRNEIEATLLPCPFCGSKPQYEGGFPDTKLVCGQCKQVSIKTSWYGNDLGIVEACWNTRTPNAVYIKNKKYREVLEYILEHECDRELIELVKRVLNDIAH